ncbi:hypothetical protein KF707_15920 [Candidatus Obscuribacterales bacterium]|nr:hypothetical protein [Candidatus Obscuribacterales bacterium]MBX3152080.1 hypothetical protein [Candidatus Obscuribacterales bacterium]
MNRAIEKNGPNSLDTGVALLDVAELYHRHNQEHDSEPIWREIETTLANYVKSGNLWKTTLATCSPAARSADDSRIKESAHIAPTCDSYQIYEPRTLSEPPYKAAQHLLLFFCRIHHRKMRYSSIPERFAWWSFRELQCNA